MQSDGRRWTINIREIVTSLVVIVSAIMAGQIQLTFLLVIIVCMVHSAPFIDEQSDFEQGIEIKGNLDKTVDALLPSIRKFMLNNGLDPMQLPDLYEYIFPDLPRDFKGNLNFKKGWLQNLSHLKRTQHVTAIYKDKRLTLDMNFGFDVMDSNYEYHLKYLLYNRKGDANIRLYKLDVNIVMTVDLNEYHLILDSIKFSNVGKYDIKFEGHLLDPLVNILTKIITVLFRNHILPVIEDYAVLIFGIKIDEWNTIVPRPNRTEIIDRLLGVVKTPTY